MINFIIEDQIYLVIIFNNKVKKLGIIFTIKFILFQRNPPPKKSKSNDKESSKKTSSKEEEHSWAIDKCRFVKVREFRGKLFVDIREFYEKNGEMLPGKKGI